MLHLTLKIKTFTECEITVIPAGNLKLIYLDWFIRRVPTSNPTVTAEIYKLLKLISN